MLLLSPFFVLILSFAWPIVNVQSLYKLSKYKGYFSTTANYSAPSRVGCAIRCHHMKCSYFSFQGVCQIHDPAAVASSNSTSIYRLFDPAGPPVDEIVDVAYNKPCTSSPHHDVLVASRAVDGDLQTQYHSASQTDTWWCVDLGLAYIIRAIDVLPHPGVPTWFKLMKIYVGTTSVTNGDFSSYTQVGYFTESWNGTYRLVFTPPSFTVGRYVAIQGTSGTEFLNLVDVKVMA
ncbi:uncharacterized protein LOC135215009 isoform X2 [Macrobrachium nipponense]|uniref:uncharacterized protein LOC135215009 isoform X2 n=1 Tax=Macrobrachium nipponense TaxID=159736 RepID=UPI0030C844E1